MRSQNASAKTMTFAVQIDGAESRSCEPFGVPPATGSLSRKASEIRTGRGDQGGEGDREPSQPGCLPWPAAWGYDTSSMPSSTGSATPGPG